MRETSPCEPFLRICLAVWCGVLLPTAVLQAATNPDVLAFYFPFYANGTWAMHPGWWNKWDGYDDKKCTGASAGDVCASDPDGKDPDNSSYDPGNCDISSPYFPALGAYSSVDPNVVSDHVSQMQSGGIGVFIVSWWGKGSGSSSQERELVDAATKLLFQRLPTGMHIGIMVDGEDYDPAYFVEDVKYVYDNYIIPYGKSKYWYVNGRPVIFQYGDGAGSENTWLNKYKAVKDKYEPDPLLIANGTPDFFQGRTEWYKKINASGRKADGLFLWSLVGGSRQVCTNTAIQNARVLDVTQYPEWANGIHGWANKYAIPTVSPGFDNTYHQGCHKYEKVLPRERATTPSNTYDYSWKWAKAPGYGTADKHNPDFICITSFNNWVEASQIEKAGVPASPCTTSRVYLSYSSPGEYLARTKTDMGSWTGYTGNP